MVVLVAIAEVVVLVVLPDLLLLKGKRDIVGVDLQQLKLGVVGVEVTLAGLK